MTSGEPTIASVLAREVLGDQPRELVEVHALAALLFGEAKDFLKLPLRNVHLVADVAGDALPLLGPEDVVRMRDLKQERAGRHGHRVRPGAVPLLLRAARRKEGANGFDAHAPRSLARHPETEWDNLTRAG